VVGGLEGVKGWGVGGLEDGRSFASIGNLLCCLALFFLSFSIFQFFLSVFIKGGGNRHSTR